MEGNQTLSLQLRRHELRCTFQRDGVLIERQLVEARAVFTGKSLEMLQRALFFKHRQLALQRIGRITDASASAAAFLARARVGR